MKEAKFANEIPKKVAQNKVWENLHEKTREQKSQMEISAKAAPLTRFLSMDCLAHVW